MQQAALTQQERLETVGRIYAAFGRGDVDGILAELADDVQWEHWRDNSAQRSGVPWMAARTGKAEVPEFFALIGGFEMHAFDVLSLAANDRDVIAEIDIDLTNPATGARLHDEELHQWRFGPDGKVVRFRHYVDTAKHIAAAY